MSTRALTVRILVGLLFLIAGASKVADPVAFAEAIYNYHLVPARLITLAAITLPWLEILAGACLLAGALTRSAALITGFLSLAFAVGIGSALARGLNIECGCFSGSSPADALHVVLNLVVMAGSFWLCARGGGDWSLDRKLALEVECSTAE
ncbi:MAG: DoxX family membrane protein [Candidatus Eremiobacteraeota bacterium]|nr:DoxX family membrane protein [Candidatus Eremiobacteraeota bacterium]